VTKLTIHVFSDVTLCLLVPDVAKTPPSFETSATTCPMTFLYEVWNSLWLLVQKCWKCSYY